MNLCIYGAASDLIDKSFIEAGEALGVEMAKRGHDLVFGGGGAGLMGAVARGVHRQGGVKITGIVPDFFIEHGKHVDGILFDNIDEYIETDTMRERKKLLDESEFENLCEEVKTILKDIGNEMIKGTVRILPSKKSKPCEYCDFSNVCRKNICL